MITLNIKKLTYTAQLPIYATEGAACFDIITDIKSIKTIGPGDMRVISTGLAFEIPEGHVMLLYSRSGHGKKGIALANGVGVIDSDYRGELGVMLKNSSDTIFSVNPGDRIAQAMIIPVPLCELVQVDKLTETTRGSGGFGSTGK